MNNLLVENFIRIRGAEQLTPYQGIGGDISTTGGTGGTDGTDGTDGTADGSISEAMWAAQNAFITGETAYLTQLNNEWKSVKDKVEGGVITNAFGLIYELLGELAEELAFKALMSALAAVGLVLTGGWVVAVGIAVSLAISAGADWIKGAFVAFLGQGNALFEAMIAENDAMLQAENSPGNYDLRNAVRAVHLQTISMLLEELERFRKTAEKISGKETSPITIEYPLDDDFDETAWDSVVSGIETSITEFSSWASQVEAADEENLPVPLPPALPSPPSGGRAMTKVLFMLAKYALALHTERMKKQRETDTHITDLVQAVQELADKEVELHLPNSNARFNIFGRSVKYGGK